VVDPERDPDLDLDVAQPCSVSPRERDDVEVGPDHVVENVLAQALEHLPRAVNLDRLVDEREDLRNKNGQRCDVIVVGVRDDDAAHAELVPRVEGVTQAPSVDRQRVVYQESRSRLEPSRVAQVTGQELNAHRGRGLRPKYACFAKHCNELLAGARRFVLELRARTPHNFSLPEAVAT